MLFSNALRQHHLDDKPLYLFGYRGGGDFVLGLANSGGRRIAGWACDAATSFPPPVRETPYGMVVSADLDGVHYDDARNYAGQLRRRGAAVAWISTRGAAQQNPKVEAFIQACFAAMLRGDKPITVDNERKIAMPAQGGSEAGSTSVLPSRAVLPGWSALHQPSGIITTTVATGIAEFPEISFALRLPSRRRDHPRILAYCYYFTDVGNVLQMARDDRSGWNQFAEARGLAVLTWNVKTLWQNLRSYDQTASRDTISQGTNLRRCGARLGRRRGEAGETIPAPGFPDAPIRMLARRKFRPSAGNAGAGALFRDRGARGEFLRASNARSGQCAVGDQQWRIRSRRAERKALLRTMPGAGISDVSSIFPRSGTSRKPGVAQFREGLFRLRSIRGRRGGKPRAPYRGAIEGTPICGGFEQRPRVPSQQNGRGAERAVRAAAQ
ncbi:MAG: hypothetical protein PHC88_13060 [Terrimicrobiaceae bacterium]|nr:hypothetical protein [Terrimicrobiaceae bacterium]